MQSPPDLIPLAPGAQAFGTDLVAASRALISEGLAAERAGLLEVADAHFREVAGLGVPLPRLLLDCGGYFKRRGLYEEAFACFAKAQPTVPGAIAQFTSGLPPAILARYLPWVAARMLGGQRPNLYGFQPVKRALVEWLGVAGATAVLATTLEPGMPLALRNVPLVSLQDVARESGLAYEELSPGREFFFPAPIVAGGSTRRGFTARTRAFFRCVLPEVVVCSKSSLLLADGQAILDYQGDELQKCPLNLDVDPIVVVAEDTRVSALGPGPSASIATFDDALSLVGAHSHAFGHWLLEFLPKVWVWLGQPGFADVPVLVDEQMPPQHREALAMFIGSDQRVVTLKPGERVRVRRLWTASMPCYLPLGPKPGPESQPDLLTVDAACFVELLRKAAPHEEPASAPSARIYLARKPSQHRRLVNHAEVEAWFRAKDFQIVDPAELPFAEQLRLMRGARMITGPDGSAVFMALFAQPGTIVRTLSHPFLDDQEWFAALCKELGIASGIVVGELVEHNQNYPLNSDYRIDLAQLDEHVGGLLHDP